MCWHDMLRGARCFMTMTSGSHIRRFGCTYYTQTVQVLVASLLWLQYPTCNGLDVLTIYVPYECSLLHCYDFSIPHAMVRMYSPYTDRTSARCFIAMTSVSHMQWLGCTHHIQTVRVLVASLLWLQDPTYNGLDVLTIYRPYKCSLLHCYDFRIPHTTVWMYSPYTDRTSARCFIAMTSGSHIRSWRRFGCNCLSNFRLKKKGATVIIFHVLRFFLLRYYQKPNSW